MTDNKYYAKKQSMYRYCKYSESKIFYVNNNKCLKKKMFLLLSFNYFQIIQKCKCRSKNNLILISYYSNVC